MKSYEENVVHACKYIDMVRTIHKLKTVISMLGVFTTVGFDESGKHKFYSNVKSTQEVYDFLGDLTLDVNLLNEYFPELEDGTFVDVETISKRLYEEVCSCVISDYDYLAKYVKDNKGTNLLPDFTLLEDYLADDDAKKIRLISEYWAIYRMLKTAYSGYDRIISYYNILNDRVVFSIETDDCVVPLTHIGGKTVFDRLLHTVAFKGTQDVTVGEVIEHIITVVRYLIRLHTEAVQGVHQYLVENNVQLDRFDGVITYLRGTKGDEYEEGVYVVEDDTIRDNLVYLVSYRKVQDFVDAVDNNEDMLDTPITSNLGTVASAIMSNIRHKHEINLQFCLGDNEIEETVRLLLTMTCVSIVNSKYIHQCVNRYIANSNFIVSTEVMNKLDTMIAYLDYCKDVYACSFDWDDRKSLIIKIKHREDEVIDLSNYLDGISIRDTLSCEDVVNLLKLIRNIISNFYHTWDSSCTSVFINAYKGFKFVSDIAKLKSDSTVSCSYNVLDDLRYTVDYFGEYKDSLVMYSDIVLPMCGEYKREVLKEALFIKEIVLQHAKPFSGLLSAIISKVLEILNHTDIDTIKTISVGVEDIKNFNTMSFVVTEVDNTRKNYSLDVKDSYYHAVYGLFSQGNSSYCIYNVSLEGLFTILSEIKDSMVQSCTYTNISSEDVNTFDVKLAQLGSRLGYVSLDTISSGIDTSSIDVSTLSPITYVNKSEDTHSNKTLAHNLAVEFIANGFDVVMRDGDDLVVYSYKDAKQEYIPKSLHTIFYDTDKLDLLPLTYYVYMDNKYN